MKRLLLSLLLATMLVPSAALAVPALPVKRTVRTLDGREIEITLRGDEHMSFWETDQGKAVRLLPDGRVRELSFFEKENMLTVAEERRQQSNARRKARPHKAIGQFKPLTGKKRGVVILVNFLDNTFSHEDPKAIYNDFFNKRGYTDYNMAGSVSDYFLAQSYGLFELDFDVVGPYTLSQNMKYYGAHEGEGDRESNDINPQAMVREACQAAAKELDFTPYDWDDDGEVDQVFVIYAGYGEAQGGSKETIWPHESRLSSVLTINGKTVSTYACSCELSGSNGTRLDGIGTACHEFSHCLGLPDFYDVKYSGGFGMGTWDLMDSGSYNNGSCTPAGYTAYERWIAGWLTPTELTQQTQITGMKPLVEEPEAYILYNEANRDEYYLLENRQPVGFDAGLYGHGMLVVHVDYFASAWRTNTVNTNAKHQRMSIIPADGDLTMSVASLRGDPFPGFTGNTMLTDDSTPAATLFNANASGDLLMNKAIEEITESEDGLISFLALRPPLDIPQLQITDRQDFAFTASWNAIDLATGYELELTETPSKKSTEEACILEEDFQGAYSKSAGFSDVSGKLNTLLSTSGFTGSKLYTTPDLLRLGTGTTTGELRSPVQDALETGNLTIVMKVKPFTAGTAVNGNVAVVTNNKPTEDISISFDQECYLVLHPTTVLDEIFRIDISATSRMYIQYLAFYDGVFSEEELGLETAQVKTMPRKVATQMLKTSDTFFTFTDLKPACNYSLRVRALAEGRISKWSEAASFASSTNGIVVPLAAGKMDSDVYYDLLGRPVATPVKHGIYIRNGRKVLY